MSGINLYFRNYVQKYDNNAALIAADTTQISAGSMVISLQSGVYMFDVDTLNATSDDLFPTNGYGLFRKSEQPFLWVDDDSVLSDLNIPNGPTLTLPNGQIYVGNASNVATAVAVTGDIGITNAGVASISAGVIVNADINAAAAIAFSKLAALPSAQVLVGSAGNVATAVALSGIVALSNAGVTSIPLTSAQVLVGNVSNVAAPVALTGAVSITNAGVTALTSGSVALANLAAGITPAYVCKFGGSQGYAGGAASTTIAIAGWTAGDLVFVQLTSSTNAVTIEKVAPGTTTTVTFSGDPGAATNMSWMLMRPAA